MKNKALTRALRKFKKETGLKEQEIAEMIGSKNRQNVGVHFTKGGKTAVIPYLPVLLKYRAIFEDKLRREISLDELTIDIKVQRFKDSNGNIKYYTNIEDIPENLIKARRPKKNKEN